ncbi:MAG: class I SAM-dependent methyltransferase [Chitinophagales bacterium]|nr:class I SAM-dependent methyltransferase [Chitinophagales bacterium]
MEFIDTASMDGKAQCMNSPMHDRCLLCNGALLKPLNRYSKILLVKCARCGFVFSQAIPAENELIRHYNLYGRNDYLSPVTVKRYHEILDYLEKFRKTNRLMDVGCGIGYFLEVAKERNWEVYGTEFTQAAVQICRKKGIETQQGKLDPENYLPASFDVITSFEVIEHINYPIQEMKNFRQLLREGGAVYITTPNFHSVSKFLLKEKWNILVYPEHLCYYTPNTISALFENTGFSNLKMETTGISTSRIKESLANVQSHCNTRSSDDEKLRTMLEANRFKRGLKSFINRILTFLYIGDSIKAVFVRDSFR